jgi:hypothetical protein
VYIKTGTNDNLLQKVHGSDVPSFICIVNLLALRSINGNVRIWSFDDNLCGFGSNDKKVALMVKHSMHRFHGFNQIKLREEIRGTNDKDGIKLFITDLRELRLKHI